MRWCCDAMRKEPVQDIPLNRRIMGIRAEESHKREKWGETSTMKSGFTIYKPIFRWKEWEIWEYIQKYNLKYPELYDQGWDRIGCVVCPFICGKNQKQIERNRERWSGMYKAFEHAMKRLYDSKEHIRQEENGYSSNFNEFIESWYKGLNRLKGE